ncbi:MAG: Hsp20/alpha crystallin family protein [Gemmatimonadetes bacterium]|nr:Hsp20/alpha crystallin family protein [Gemmatimonadota bacterium]
MFYRTTLPLPMVSFRRDLTRLFDAPFTPERGDAWAPAVDVREDERAMTFRVDLPGVAPEGVSVTADRGVLTIAGERAAEEQTSDTRFHLVERSYGSFRRAFHLPETVDQEKVEALFANGVLTVTVAKKVPPTPRKIEVKTV